MRWYPAQSALLAAPKPACYNRFHVSIGGRMSHFETEI